MSSILYYISGHGYGHAVRSCQVIRSIRRARPDIKVFVRSTAPRWLFDDLGFPVFQAPRSTDVGMVQKDSLDMAVGDTWQACRKLHEQIPQLVAEEIAFIEENHIRLVLGDIPPLCFEIADRAALPSVAISNFTWDWIYRRYAAEYPAFVPLIEEMETFYRKATLALKLPYSCDLGIFPASEPIPFIARSSRLSTEEAKRRFGLPRGAVVVLLSFGGLGLGRFATDRLARHEDFYFVTTGEAARKDSNLLVLPSTQRRYEDLVRAADIVVSKPGYGIVADVIAHRVPILYTSRGDFPEFPFLVEALQHCATCEFIPQEELLAGNLAAYLRRLVEKKKHWPAMSLNGADVAAEKVVALLNG